MINLTDRYNISQKYSYYSYSIWIGILGRFSNYFDPNTFTSNCSKLINTLEGRSLRLIENY